jgi:hypothetical protein
LELLNSVLHLPDFITKLLAVANTMDNKIKAFTTELEALDINANKVSEYIEDKKIE